MESVKPAIACLARAVSRLQWNRPVGQLRTDLHDGSVHATEIRHFRRALEFLGGHLIKGRKESRHGIVDPDACQGDANVFKKYSQMKLQTKRKAKEAEPAGE
jgi:hypothetical protein